MLFSFFYLLPTNSLLASPPLTSLLVVQVWGKVFLYYDETPDGLAYWVVGPKVGSSAVNLYAVSSATSADEIAAVWHGASARCCYSQLTSAFSCFY